jgi:hypothetical protein
VEQSVGRLAAAGPALGPPLVGTLEHSELRNLKELRSGSRGWSRWYENAISLAEVRYADYRAEKEADR